MIHVLELNDYLEEFIEDKKEKKDITQDTIKKQTYIIKKFIKYLQETNITEINNNNIKRCLKKYRSHCLNYQRNKRTTVKTYLLPIIDFLNYDEIQTQTQHQKIKIKDIIEVKTESPETARKRIEKISLNKKQTNFF